jgi:CPA1 family monovalent cation:H+ antiporter
MMILKFEIFFGRAMGIVAWSGGSGLRAVEVVLVLVVLATAVAASARWLRVPAPSLLVVAGLVVAVIPGVPSIQVAPDDVGLVVLPPLLYAAGQDLPWRELRPVWKPVSILAVGLVIASAAAVTMVARAVTPLPTGMAFVLGAVLASTDPVAVTALGRRLSLPARVYALIQAESLFNDATSLVLVRVAAAAAVAGGALSWGRGAGQFLLLGGGGALVGVVVAFGVALIRRRTEDPVLETVTALVTPYCAYVAAEALHISGITSVVVASVILAGQAPRLTNGRIRLQVRAVYDTVVFLLESVVFSLIGLELPSLIRVVGTSDRVTWIVAALAITATLLLVRAIWVFPLWLAVPSRPSWKVPIVVSWAGARGVLPLAAALSIPVAAGESSRDLVLLLTTAVIVLTLTVQGFTLGPLVSRSGVTVPAGHARAEEDTARAAMTRAALAYLDGLADAEATRLREVLESRPDKGLRRDVIAVEEAELSRLYEDGAIGADTHRRLQRRLDLEDVSLDE